jgi:hypothetical protein
MTHQASYQLSKHQIAELQLFRAVTLLDGVDGDSTFDPVSALTLAGVAEEILGQMVRAKGIPNALEAAKHADAHSWYWIPENELDEEFNQIGRELNQLKNEVKHNHGGQNKLVKAYFVEEAEDMALRAIENYIKLNGDFPPDLRIRDWYERITS